MVRYLIRRILWAIALFFAVTIVSYVLFYIIPADPAKQACGQACTEIQTKRVKHFLGLDRPIYVQYGKFVGRLLPFDFSKPGFKTPSPITGYADFFNPPPYSPGGPVQWAYHMILPWATFAILFAALYVRMIRANVLETMNEDYVRTARAKGASESRVLRVHILRNALLPIVTMLGMDIGYALGGAIFTESVYSLPGLGRTAIQAIEGFDLPTTQGVVVFATLCIITFNLIVDLLYAWIDPRIRLT